MLETTKEDRARIVAAIHKTYGTVSAHPFNKPTQPRKWAQDMLALCCDVDTVLEALPDATKLEWLADWLDEDDQRRNRAGHDEVQRALRAWAAKARAVLDCGSAQRPAATG